MRIILILDTIIAVVYTWQYFREKMSFYLAWVYIIKISYSIYKGAL